MERQNPKLPRVRPAGETGARGVWAPGRMLQDSGTVVYTSSAQLWVPTLYGDEDPGACGRAASFAQ